LDDLDLMGVRIINVEYRCVPKTGGHRGRSHSITVAAQHRTNGAFNDPRTEFSQFKWFTCALSS